MAPDSPTLVVLIPTLGRADRLGALAERFAATSPPHRILFVCDRSDTASIAAGLDAGHVLVHDGTYPVKVNAGIRATDEEYLMVAADDVNPHEGWFEKALELMSEQVGFVSLNDLGNEAVMRGEHATLPLVARWYVADGELYHEGYEHTGCDVDASYIAKSKGAFAYAPEAVMEHMHPVWGKGEVDETYRLGGMNPDKDAHDRVLLSTRRHLWS